MRLKVVKIKSGKKYFFLVLSDALHKTNYILHVNQPIIKKNISIPSKNLNDEYQKWLYTNSKFNVVIFVKI